MHKHTIFNSMRRNVACFSAEERPGTRDWVLARLFSNAMSSPAWVGSMQQAGHGNYYLRA